MNESYEENIRSDNCEEVTYEVAEKIEALFSKVGSGSYDLGVLLVDQVVNASLPPDFNKKNKQLGIVDAMVALSDQYVGKTEKNPLITLLISQMVVSHNQALNTMAMSLNARDTLSAERLMNKSLKLQKLYLDQMNCVRKFNSCEQRIKVEYVHINPEAKEVVATENQKGGGC